MGHLVLEKYPAQNISHTMRSCVSKSVDFQRGRRCVSSILCVLRRKGQHLKSDFFEDCNGSRSQKENVSGDTTKGSPSWGGRVDKEPNQKISVSF